MSELWRLDTDQALTPASIPKVFILSVAALGLVGLFFIADREVRINFPAQRLVETRYLRGRTWHRVIPFTTLCAAKVEVTDDPGIGPEGVFILRFTDGRPPDRLFHCGKARIAETQSLAARLTAAIAAAKEMESAPPQPRASSH